MTFDQLDPATQASLRSVIDEGRPLAGELARVLLKIKIARANNGAQWAQAVLSQLSADALIPNGTGLAGAAALTVAQCQALDAFFAAAANLATDPVLAACSTAAGATNVVG